jgi:hypothetical protein
MKQIVSRIINEEERVKREYKGRRLAISRSSVYRLDIIPTCFMCNQVLDPAADIIT